MPVLNENDIVIAVRDHIAAAGWTIEQFCLSNQQGPDVLAELNGDRLLVEAKGATSSRVGSAKYGKPYGSAEVRINIAEALYTACAGAGAGAGGGLHARVAAAFQDDPLHRRYVQPLDPVFGQLDIGVFWVDADTRAVTLEATWRL